MLFSVWRNQRYANQSKVGRLPVLIEALEKKVALHGQDAARIEPQSLSPSIALHLGGRKLVGPDTVGGALRGLVKAAREEVRTGNRRIERIVGCFGGLDLGILAARSEETPSLYLAGHYLYHAAPCQTGPALVTALPAAQESVSKRLDDIRLELARPFEHEGRLTALLARREEVLPAA